MEIILYGILAVVGYRCLKSLVGLYYAAKIVRFFMKHPERLPEELPDYVAEFRQDIGDDKFYELYKESRK